MSEVILERHRKQPNNNGKCLKCDHVGKLIKGMCNRHYQQTITKRRRAKELYVGKY